MKKLFVFFVTLLFCVSISKAVIVDLYAPAGTTWKGPDKKGVARAVQTNPSGNGVNVYCDETVSGMCVENHGEYLKIDFQPGTGGVQNSYHAD